MAFFTINQVAIRGISAAVPKNNVSNYELSGFEKEELQKLVSTIGIENRRVALSQQCASDLCVGAAQKLMQELKWSPNEIKVVFFVSQTPDYPVPGTSMHILERLKVPASCVAFDINQGCAGFVYGLSLISAFMASSKLKKGLLLVGDTITKLISPYDKSLLPIFADAGTATALEFDTKAKPMIFNTSSDGAAYDAIIVPQGGARVPLDESSFEYNHVGNAGKRKSYHLKMKGLDVFNFSLKKVTPNIEELLNKSGQSPEILDYFVLHQANRLILESIAKKLNVPINKVPSSLKDYGNTSGATIPITIASQLRQENKIVNSNLLLSGFGVGLSIASAVVNFNEVICPEIIDI